MREVLHSPSTAPAQAWRAEAAQSGARLRRPGCRAATPRCSTEEILRATTLHLDGRGLYALPRPHHTRHLDHTHQRTGIRLALIPCPHAATGLCPGRVRRVRASSAEVALLQVCHLLADGAGVVHGRTVGRTMSTIRRRAVLIAYAWLLVAVWRVVAAFVMRSRGARRQIK